MSTPAMTSSPEGASSTMAPPATPRAYSPTPTPSASISPSIPHTPGTSTSPSIPRTPGVTLKSCSSDPKEFDEVKIHTAKCTECDQRNQSDKMLRCPGCGWQICVPCQEKRTKKGRDLTHGCMGTPGGLLGLGRLGSGVRRRRVLGSIKSPVVEKKEEDVERETNGGKGKAKAAESPKSAGKKRSVKSNPKAIISNESSDDDFAPDPTSPTSHKRRRTTLTITDTPTATSTRPHRKPTASTYVAPSSPGLDSSSIAELTAGVDRRPTTLNSKETRKAWNMDVNNMPRSRIQELLEQNGVNTPGNRYEQHFLERCEPVVTSPTIVIPEVVRRMSDPAPCLSAEQRVDARDKAAIDQAAAHALTQTVRHYVSTFSAHHSTLNPHISADETQELSYAIKEAARKWAVRTHDKLPVALQSIVERNLDLRLDHIDLTYKAQLVKLLEHCAARKLKEFAQDRAAMLTPERHEGDDGEQSVNGAPLLESLERPCIG